MSNDLVELLTEQGHALRAFKSNIESRLDRERREREDLELRFSRPGGGGGGSGSEREQKLAEERQHIGAFAKSKSGEVEMKGLSVGSDPDGGYVVLPHYSGSMTRKIWDRSPMRQLARVEVITKGDSWEEIDDYGQPDAAWGGEHLDIPETSSPQIAKLRVPLHEIYAEPKATQKILDLAEIDVGRWLEDKLADKFARVEGNAYVNGDGANKPKGILQHTVSAAGDATRTRGNIQRILTGATSGFTTSAQFDKVLDLYFSLRSPYRQNSTWLMNSDTANRVSKFKDTTNNYIWSRSMISGTPDMLLGRPVVIDEEFPSVGTNTFPIALGDWQKAYLVLDWNAMKLLRDPYTQKGYTKFFCYRRTGGGVMDPDAFKLLKCATG